MNGYRPARDLYTKEAPDALKLSYSLASLEKNWEKVAGSALASRTQLASCKITEEGIFITVNVADPGIIQAVKFRKNLLAKSVAKFLKTAKVTVEIKQGKILYKSNAKEAAPACMRRAPVLISEEQLESETAKLKESGLDPDIAEALARLKITSVRLSERESK